MNRFSRNSVAAAAFLTALTGTLIAFPLILDNPALALDSNAASPAAGGHLRLPSARIEPRLAYLKTALGITESQTRPWDAFADVLRRQARARDAKIAAMMAERDARLTAIERMENRQAMMADEAAALSEQLTAAKPLYASLSDEQKQLADDFLTRRFGAPPFGHGGSGPNRPE